MTARSIYIVFKPTDLADAVERVQACLNEIREWMSTNMLILNDEKTEIVHFSSKFMGFEKLDGLSVGKSFVKCRSSVRCLSRQ